MKKFLKYLLILLFIPVLSFTFVSLTFSNEKVITWLFESLSKEFGYKTKILVTDLDWSFTKSHIYLQDFIATGNAKENSIYSDSLVLSIDLLNLVSRINLYPFNSIKPKNFLLVEIDKATVQLKNFDLNESFSRNKFSNFILNNSLLRLDELYITGSIKEVDIPKYFYLFTNNSSKTSLPKISVRDAFVSKIKLGPLELLDTNLSLNPLSKSFEFVVSSSDIKGKIVVKQPIKEGIGLNLSSLQLRLDNFNTTNIFVYLLDNLTIPINLSVDKLFLDEKDFGQLSLLVTKENEKLKFNQLEYKGINLDLGRNIEDEVNKRNFFLVSRKDKSIYSSFQGEIFTDNLSQSLLDLKGTDYGLNFLAGASNINLDISWAGLPNQFNINNVEGNLSFRIDDFLTKDIDSDILSSSDLLRLVSLFNVSNTFGDLTNINFKEKFNKGFQADRVEGSLEFKRNQIKTSNPIVFKSGSGEFKWNGFIQKTKEGELNNLDFDILITLPLREYLPAYALILGGPVTAATVFIAGKAFKKPLNKLSSGKWKITGTIEEPITQFVEWFE